MQGEGDARQRIPRGFQVLCFQSGNLNTRKFAIESYLLIQWRAKTGRRISSWIQEWPPPPSLWRWASRPDVFWRSLCSNWRWGVFAARKHSREAPAWLRAQRTSGQVTVEWPSPAPTELPAKPASRTSSLQEAASGFFPPLPCFSFPAFQILARQEFSRSSQTLPSNNR